MVGAALAVAQTLRRNQLTPQPPIQKQGNRKGCPNDYRKGCPNDYPNNKSKNQYGNLRHKIAFRNIETPL
jgi:energy-converting hydrogenase Eha subunit F